MDKKIKKNPADCCESVIMHPKTEPKPGLDVKWECGKGNIIAELRISDGHAQSWKANIYVQCRTYE